ncbi:hypothetical protein [Flagellimonas sp. GZD32]|uniref:hypothetical protein n=1 Tax=Flagellimonas cixiensis TaxID=3228750 RepID=UPI0035C93E46
MLPQKTYGPPNFVQTSIDAGNLKNGDIAGLIALQNRYGYVGIKKENGKTSIVVVRPLQEIDKKRAPFK